MGFCAALLSCLATCSTFFSLTVPAALITLNDCGTSSKGWSLSRSDSQVHACSRSTGPSPSLSYST